MFENETARLKELDKQIKELTNEQKTIKNQIIAETKKNYVGGATYGELQVIKESDYVALVIDEERLKAEQPDLYLNYTKLSYKVGAYKVQFVRGKKNG